MQFITDWVTNIILIILLATVLELLLPNSNFQRYVKMVVGLMLIVVILTPLLSVFSHSPETIFQPINMNEDLSDEQLENLIENKKTDIEMGQRAYISEQVAVQMKQQVEEELVNDYGLEVKEVLISIDEFANEEDFLKSITGIEVVVKQQVEQTEEEAKVEAIPVVMIDTKKELQTKKLTEQPANLSEVQLYLANEWQIPKEVISLALEGGDE
ncbi:stage III sporulation protein AF [Anaerobacillus sp. MEB173]|uniref:stage III sporulation protein AF n=1 Tax=Anaerobacillus sp. MEB173 TaxID=3383345 RepID=UPI003F9166FA